MPDYLSTGIHVLDRRIGGGIPVGSVATFSSPAASQGELFLYELTSSRETLYITTDRTEDGVQEAIRNCTARTGKPHIRYVSGDAPLENTRRLLRNVGEGWNLIIDTVDVLEETDPARYRNFLNGLKNEMQNSRSIAVLHALSDNQTPARATTQHMADVVFDLRVDIDGGDVETNLAVLKLRGASAPTETIKLELAEEVHIDTSRDIA